MHRGKAMCQHSKKAAVNKTGKETSPETHHTGFLVLDSHPLELWENKFLLFKPLSNYYYYYYCESAACNMPANLENSAVAPGLKKVSFHSSP